MSLCFHASIPFRIYPRLRHQRPLQITSTIKRRVATPRTSFMKIDSHVHVWDPVFPTHPDHPLPPSLPGTQADLLNCMDDAGIDKTVIVQPINYKFDHTYVLNAIKKHPSRFVGVALADTALAPSVACETLEQLVAQGFRGIRINPTFKPDGFADETVKALVRRAGELDIPVTLFAKPEHLDDVTMLLTEYPKCRILLDHFAFCSPGELEAQKKLLDMGSSHTNLYVKTSAWFRVSNDQWPHADLYPFLKELIETFGANRLLIGSDFPFVKEQYEYSQSFALLEKAPIAAEDRDWILGKTAATLYKM